MSNESKTRTITLTGRPPVTIKEVAWPLIASASDKEFDNQYEFQANEISKWYVGVRQHEDGRAIVYATYNFSTNWQNRRDFSAKRGKLLDAGCSNEEICQEIANVCEDIQSCEHHCGDAERWLSLRDECIADMPSEMLE